MTPRRLLFDMDVLLLCGPSGVGKTTLLLRLVKQFPHDFARALSHTTRAPRPSERHAHDYFFTSTMPPRGSCLHYPARPFRKIMSGGPHAMEDYAYVLTKRSVLDITHQGGKVAVADVSTKSLKSIQQNIQDDLKLRVCSIFIHPGNNWDEPSMSNQTVSTRSRRPRSKIAQEPHTSWFAEEVLRSRICHRYAKTNSKISAETIDLEVRTRLRFSIKELNFFHRHPDHFQHVIYDGSWTPVKKLDDQCSSIDHSPVKNNPVLSSSDLLSPPIHNHPLHAYVPIPAPSKLHESPSSYLTLCRILKIL